MARRAKILLVGTLVAILPCGATTSQTLPSVVLNNQVQLGDVFSQQTLNVVEVSDQTTADTTATGNAFEATVSGDVDMRSNQTLQADVTADTRVNVTGEVRQRLQRPSKVGQVACRDEEEHLAQVTQVAAKEGSGGAVQKRRASR